MSHMSTYKQKVHNIEGFVKIATELEYGVRQGEGLVVKQFGSNEVKCVAAIKLPGWQYEVAVNKDGEIVYDHFGSKKDSLDLLGGLIQIHNIAETMEKVPFHELQNYYIQEKKSGDRVMVLEYE